jgi:hypothetical protein
MFPDFTRFERSRCSDPAVHDRAISADKVAELLIVAKTLRLDERRRLVVKLDALDKRDAGAGSSRRDPLAALRALAGTVHSDSDDLSTDKYAHVCAAARDSDG